MIPRRRRPEPIGLREPPQVRSQAHLAWVRGHECSVSAAMLIKGIGCNGRIKAAHVRTGTDGGMGVKPSDIWAIPLCCFHHAQQHAIGEIAFEAIYGINMRLIAEALAAKSPHRHKWSEKR